ncbi:GtrA family protein [Altererythrobacter sp. Root672]|uniref:GtrA family protein n=1 Tax=Altererythrobacter sp. Root672 TaxID=1736584 RepID=UPI000B203A8A|nr:GtrA family protein [Altererythrobacter sp. Root672]
MALLEIDGDELRNELAAIGRFILVGILNTAIGYAIILTGLAAGLGDYSANLAGFVLGFPIAYTLQRRWTFRTSSKATILEAALYALCFLAAYGINLAVIAIGRRLGYEENAIVQLAAICFYSGSFYVLTRLIVFRGKAPASQSRRN